MKVLCHKKPFFQAIFVILIIGLFILPASATVFHEQQSTTRGSTLYVDDDNIQGPWEGTIDHPYQFIQDGIDHANIGDTVFVFAGFYIENVVVSKSLEIIGEDKDSTTITGDDFGTVVKIVAEEVTLTGFRITRCGVNPNNAGLMIHTSNNIITNNEIRFNHNFGLYVTAGNNVIYHNNFLQNTYQAFDVLASSTWDGGYPTGGNYWDDYTGTDANEDGIGEAPYPTGNSSADRYPLIHPYGSVSNKDTEEIFLSIQAAINDADTHNGHTIYARPGTYWEHLSITKSIILLGSQDDTVIIDGRSSGDVVTIYADEAHLEGFRIQHSGSGEQNAGIIVHGNNCSLIKNIIYENLQGTILQPATKNAQIINNRIMKNGWNGITLLAGCQGVTISENTIADNFYAGLGITAASNNHIYHNNFKTNRHQAYDDAANIWDDGYPSGGNYWSNYNGSDEDGDGIGDAPYEIPQGMNIDRYPLMNPYIGGDTIPPFVNIQTPRNGVYFWGLRLFSGVLRKNTVIYGPITIQVEATDAQSGIQRVEFLIDNALTPAFVDTQAPYSWRWSQPYLFMRKHTIIVIAYDNAGNPNFGMLEVKKYL